MKKLSCFAVLVLGSAVSMQAAAAVQSLTPGANQQRSRQVLEHYEQERELERLKVQQQREQQPNVDNQVSQGGAKQAAKASPKFMLKQVQVGPSEILSEQEIAAIIGKYVGREADIQALFNLVAEINALYAAKNFPTAKAVLPPQKVSQGVVQIKLIEARIGKVIVEGNDSTKTSYIEKRVALQGGELLDVGRLDAEISRFNRINDVGLRAEVRPGESFGTIDTVLRAQEPSRYQLATFIDNAGQDSIGNERLGVSFYNASLFGYRDSLSFTSVGSEGSVDGSISYSIPFTAYDTRIGLSYSKGKIDIKNGALASANIDGDSEVSTVNLVQPFLWSANTKIEAFFTADHKKSATDFDGTTIADNEVHAYTLGASALYVDENGVWLIRNSLTWGEERNSGESYERYNGELTRMQRLQAGKTLTWRTSWQLSGDNFLPSAEQFQVGGVATVRGYSEGMRIGDDGYYTSVEFNFPLYKKWNDEASALFGGQVRGALFFDHGAAFPYKGNKFGSDSEDFLTAAGFGVVMGFDWGLTGRLDVAFPLAQRDDDNSDQKVHFLLQYNFF